MTLQHIIKYLRESIGLCDKRDIQIIAKNAKGKLDKLDRYYGENPEKNRNPAHSEISVINNEVALLLGGNPPDFVEIE